MTDAEWLASLKVGDEVAYDTGSISKHWIITRIVKITPTGQIRTDAGHLFKNGTYKRDWNYYFLKPVTDTIRDAVTRREIIGLLKRFDFSKLLTPDLEKVSRIIDDARHTQRHEAMSNGCTIKQCLELGKDECRECVDAARKEGEHGNTSIGDIK